MNEKEKTDFNSEEYDPVEINLDCYFYGIPDDIIRDYNHIDKVSLECIRLCGATVKEKLIVPIGDSGAATGLYALQESELSWHTTPEKKPNFMSYKISLCDKLNPLFCMEHLMSEIKPAAGKNCF